MGKNSRGPMITAKPATFRRDAQFPPFGQPMTQQSRRVLRTKIDLDRSRESIPAPGYLKQRFLSKKCQKNVGQKMFGKMVEKKLGQNNGWVKFNFC